MENKKEEKKSSSKTGCLVLLVIAVGIFLIYFLPAIKENKEFREKLTSLTLSSEEILVTSHPGYYRTQCYATNNSDKIWKGSVSMRVKDDDGGYLYAGSSWPEVEINPGERTYRVAKIPTDEYLIKNAPQGILVIVWSWRNQEVTKRVKIR
ncbi:hypothetical protein ES708_34095 [subsurface metagenome]